MISSYARQCQLDWSGQMNQVTVRQAFELIEYVRRWTGKYQDLNGLSIFSIASYNYMQKCLEEMFVSLISALPEFARKDQRFASQPLTAELMIMFDHLVAAWSGFMYSHFLRQAFAVEAVPAMS